MRPSETLPVRMRNDGRTATWNPAVTRAGYVLVHVRGVDGAVEVRRSINSGRARVREGETIEKVTAGGA
jgi:hypothetical protein